METRNQRGAFPENQMGQQEQTGQPTLIAMQFQLVTKEHPSKILSRRVMQEHEEIKIPFQIL